ncbi:SdpI family protein [Filifactor villosus]|uniref:SdpI family protein n=1 Tax=Filifactor villosus TaxID=29374 RepID=A0ABV9QM15_9FIRM
MGFWIFMLVMDLLIPFTMLGFGRLFSKNPPKEINMMFGYRTSMSMKNKETWDFAHKHFGRLWYISSLVIFPLSLFPLLFVIGKSDDVIGKVGGTICFLQFIPFIGSIFPTELALRKNFDKDGRRK